MMEGDAPDLRLTIELVPAGCWYSNLRQALPREAWDRIRRSVYAACNYRCATCGARGKLHCHEVWAYDDAAHVQRLAGFQALCESCHHVKHLGHAGILASQGKLDYDRLVAHFLRVNGCDRAAFERHRREAFEQWEERSRHEWTTDFRLT
ncbi:MAG TPA: HNH endonuclease [Ktedonobacterales bacterium]